MTRVALIVAAAANGVIGCDNRLPWHLPQDLKYFKATTLGKPVVMGRKTWDSIGRPLPGRTNIVVTRQADWSAPPDVVVAHDLSEAIRLAHKALESLSDAVPQDSEVIVMGGAEIYRQALPLADRVYLTRVELEPEGDAHFPDLPEAEWALRSSEAGEEAAPVAHKFLIYERLESLGAG